MADKEILNRLERFYKAYNPEKIGEIETVLDKYKGKEEQLFQALIKKYGPEPTSEMVPPPPAPFNGNVVMKERLVAFYTKYNPEKVDEVDTVLTKYKGKEAALFDALVRKYGPEPGDDDDEDQEADEEGSDQENDEYDGIFRKVLYCPIDTLPPEYCEYGPCFDECKTWLLENCPDLHLQKYNRTVEGLVEAEKQIAAGVEGITLEVSGSDKKNKRKLGIKDKKSNPENKNTPVYIEKLQRSKKKSVTLIVGLEGCGDIKLKDAAKKLGKKFACSASVNKLDSGGQQIQLQGDCLNELPDLLVDMFNVDPERIYFLHKGKTEPAF